VVNARTNYLPVPETPTKPRLCDGLEQKGVGDLEVEPAVLLETRILLFVRWRHGQTRRVGFEDAPALERDQEW